MRKIKVAQIGVNAYSHGIDIFDNMKKHDLLFELAGYVLPEKEKERLPQVVAKLDGVPELTLEEVLNNSEIEAVTIEVDEIYLTKYAFLAAQHGKHIHMEKPGGITLFEFEKLIETVKRNNVILHLGYMYRYNPYIQELIEQIEKGDLGEIISVEAQMSCWHPVTTRQWLENLPGGMMFYLGCHLIDFIIRIQGAPKAVIPLNKCSGIEGVTAEDVCMAVLEYEHGISFAKTSAVELGGFGRRQLVVSGTKATVELKPLEWYLPGFERLQTTRIVRNSTNWHTKDEPEKCMPIGRYDAMMTSFAKMVRGEMVNPYSPDYELELYKTILKACGRECCV